MSFVEQFEADGWLKIGKVFDPAFIDELNGEFEGQYKALTAHERGHRPRTRQQTVDHPRR